MIKNIKFIEGYKYLFIGAINTVFGYGVFSLFIFFDYHYSVAVLVATILGVLFNFFSYGIFVFNNHSNRLIIRFAFVYVILYFVNVLLLYLSNFVINDLYISGAILAPLMALLGYILNKRFVWKSS